MTADTEARLRAAANRASPWVDVALLREAADALAANREREAKMREAMREVFSIPPEDLFGPDRDNLIRIIAEMRLVARAALGGGNA